MRVGQSRLERRLPGRVLTEAGLEDVAEDDFFDLRDAAPPARRCAAQRLGDGDGPELRSRHVRQRAEILADRRPGRGEEKGVGHHVFPRAWKERHIHYYQL